MLTRWQRGVFVLVLASAMAVACVGPASGGPQDDDTGAAPPVTVSANSFYDEGTSTSAWVQIDAAGSSGGALESGQEQQVIKSAAAAAGVPDATSAGGDSGGSSANDESSGTSGTAPILTECSWRAADLPPGAPEWQGNDPSTGQLMVDPCNGQQLYVFVPNAALGIVPAAPLPPPDPAALAQQAYAELVPPSPTAHRSPTEDLSGGAWTLVNLWTWFWVDRTDWVPLTRTVELRGVSATVTATPIVTTFDPGNGDTFVSCDGPGKAWVDPKDNSDPQPVTVGGCGYQYRQVSEGVQATTSIRYTVSWTSSTGAGGTLPDLAGSSTSAPFRVEQVQVVVGGS